MPKSLARLVRECRLTKSDHGTRALPHTINITVRHATVSSFIYLRTMSLSDVFIRDPTLYILSNLEHLTTLSLQECTYEMHRIGHPGGPQLPTFKLHTLEIHGSMAPPRRVTLSLASPSSLKVLKTSQREVLDAFIWLAPSTNDLQSLLLEEIDVYVTAHSYLLLITLLGRTPMLNTLFINAVTFPAYMTPFGDFQPLEGVSSSNEDPPLPLLRSIRCLPRMLNGFVQPKQIAYIKTLDLGTRVVYRHLLSRREEECALVDAQLKAAVQAETVRLSMQSFRELYHIPLPRATKKLIVTSWSEALEFPKTVSFLALYFSLR